MGRMVVGSNLRTGKVFSPVEYPLNTTQNIFVPLTDCNQMRYVLLPINTCCACGR